MNEKNDVLHSNDEIRDAYEAIAQYRALAKHAQPATGGEEER